MTLVFFSGSAMHHIIAEHPIPAAVIVVDVPVFALLCCAGLLRFSSPKVPEWRLTAGAWLFAFLHNKIKYIEKGDK